MTLLQSDSSGDLTQDMYVGLQCHNCLRGVEMHRRGDDNCVQF